ncbi:MAG TPA: DNA polymerase III subunit delta [Magnetospirillaceae bacterium]|jgi:DNA polymerase-3 subunit delta
MKIQPARIRSFLTAPDKAARAILVYGPDAGLADERVDAMAKAVVPDLNDAFRVARLTSSQLSADPARLADEAAALAFGGGRRVVLVDDADEHATNAAKGFLAAPPPSSDGGDALVLLKAGDLSPRSGLRSLFEEADNAAAIPCYMDDGEALAGVVREVLGKHGIAADADAFEYLTDHLGGDRRATRGELEKVAIYLGRPGRLTLEDAMACVGDGAAMTLDDLALAAADGDQAQAQRVLDKMLGEGTHPVAVVRALGRHFKRLHLLAGMTGAGKTADQAIASLKPKPFFRTAQRLRSQVARWPAARAATALDLLQQAEIDTKTTGLPADAICGRAVMQLARAAGRAK